jgi:hypothetical protein
MNKAQSNPRTERSTLDKVVAVGSVALALDAIIVPFLTGKTIHEHLGLPPASDYKVLGERTALMAEQALWGVTMLYQLGKDYYNRHYKS